MVGMSNFAFGRIFVFLETVVDPFCDFTRSRGFVEHPSAVWFSFGTSRSLPDWIWARRAVLTEVYFCFARTMYFVETSMFFASSKISRGEWWFCKISRISLGKWQFREIFVISLWKMTVPRDFQHFLWKVMVPRDFQHSHWVMVPWDFQYFPQKVMVPRFPVFHAETDGSGRFLIFLTEVIVENDFSSPSSGGLTKSCDDSTRAFHEVCLFTAEVCRGGLFIRENLPRHILPFRRYDFVWYFNGYVTTSRR